MAQSKPSLYTVVSPALLHLYDVKDTIVVVIDVLRATSTIATALSNGAACVVPVDDIGKCIALGKSLSGITAGERDGKIAEGLEYGNSPFEYPREFVGGKILVLTTTNGTRLLHMALARGASHIITGSFANFSAVCEYLVNQQQPVLLACSAWKDRVNIEDTLFAGAVVKNVRQHFSINCDASGVAETLYEAAGPDLYKFLKEKDATHYQRLTGFGLERDLKYCLTMDTANVLPFYENEKLVIHQGQNNFAS
ncbi:MAG: 2-phosphosulfolactate phosphatase [Chitinophagaceae bacterium]|nr:2-phosphosulfolactate phosphatase [Chitinophagaceae bacterium]